MANLNSPLLSVNNLSFSYGNVSVLFDVSLKVFKSQIVVLLGANGAGKSTLLKVISGSFPFREGEIIYEGQSLKKIPPQNIVQRGISFIAEGRQIFRELTVEDNLQLGAYIRRNVPRSELNKDYEEIFEYFPILKERLKQRAGTLSGGQQQMLTIASSLLSKPKLLLIDEPSLGLAPKIIAELWKIFIKLKDKGLTILLIEQNAKLALEISDYAYILKNGSFSVEGKSEDLIKSDLIKGAYF